METRKFNHTEAFCLMEYRYVSNPKGGFLIWNSRDGVTPFIVFYEGREMKHVNWGRDQQVTDIDYIKSVILRPGNHIFRDTTAEEAV